MEKRFHDVIIKVDDFAGKLGGAINKVFVKTVIGISFTIFVIFFGTVVFISKFLRSLFGFKHETT